MILNALYHLAFPTVEDEFPCDGAIAVLCLGAFFLVHQMTILLWLLCRPDVIGQLNATLLQELQLPCRNAFIENDARTDAGAPILFCYLPDLPRLFRFLSALELLQMKGAILCFDFQAGALRPLCGDKVELQIIDFAEFERRFLTSP